MLFFHADSMQVFARPPARNRGKFATPVRAFGDPAAPPDPFVANPFRTPLPSMTA